MNNNRHWELNEKGEIIRTNLLGNVGKKYKSDTYFDNPVMSILNMVLCAIVDFFVFCSLFSKISYDDLIMMVVQIVGLLFGFDMVPIFIGIQLRRVRQGISRDKFILVFAFIACAMAFAMNVILRLKTMDIMSPDLSGATTSYFGSISADEAEAAAATDPTAWAMAVYGICLPVVTSIGSFFISYLTYNPLMIRRKRIDEMLIEKRDNIRRDRAVITEMEEDIDFMERLMEYDEEKYKISLQEIKVQAAQYCEYVKLCIAEYLQDPSATSLLTEEDCGMLFRRLDEAMEALEARI